MKPLLKIFFAFFLCLLSSHIVYAQPTYTSKSKRAIRNYEEAKENYVTFLQKPSENTDINKAAELGIQDCDFAVSALANPVPFKPVNAGNGINSKYDEYFPSITADEQTFLFTRKLPSDKT